MKEEKPISIIKKVIDTAEVKIKKRLAKIEAIENRDIVSEHLTVNREINQAIAERWYEHRFDDMKALIEKKEAIPGFLSGKRRLALIDERIRLNAELSELALLRLRLGFTNYKNNQQ